jgi:hypothetical protein
MDMYGFLPPFREAKFCGVSSRVLDKLGFAAIGKRLRNTGLKQGCQRFRQTGHLQRYVVRGGGAFEYLYHNQNKTEHYNKSSLNLP